MKLSEDINSEFIARMVDQYHVIRDSQLAVWRDKAAGLEEQIETQTQIINDVHDRHAEMVLKLNDKIAGIEK